jgi:hypothetical protein
MRWLAKELAKNDKSLVAFWPLFGNLFDHSGGMHHGTEVNSALTPIQPSFAYTGRSGHTFGVQSTDQYISIGHVEELNFDYNHPFSISFWFNVINNITSGVSVIANYDSTTGTGYEVNIYTDVNGAYVYFVLMSAGTFLTSAYGYLSPTNTGVYTGKWYHVVITYDGSGLVSGIAIYSNGYKTPMFIVYDDITGNSIANANTQVMIGNGSLQTSLTSQCIQSLMRIWNRKINDIEIARLYHNELDMYRPRKAYIPIFKFNNNITLFIAGPPGKTDSIPLYTLGPLQQTSNIPLYITGYSSINANIPLYIAGHLAINNSIPLHIAGMIIKTNVLNLHVHCETNKFNNWPFVPLCITGVHTGTSGLYKSIPLYISGTALSHGMNLFLKGSDVDQTVANMNLYVFGIPYDNTNWAPLFMCNTQTGVQDNITLYISNLDEVPPLPVGTVIGKPLNLFIKRWPSNAISLYISASSKTFDNVPLYINGLNEGRATTYTRWLPTVLNMSRRTFGVIYHKSVANNFCTLFISGF